MYRQATKSNRLHLGAIVAFATLLAVLATGCSKDDKREHATGLPEGERPAILLITLDTTRADRLGIESDKVETPHLKSLADRGL